MFEATVAARPPKSTPDRITAWIDLGDSRAIAARATVKDHPGFKDVERRRKAGELTSPYLSASSPALLYLPAAAARHFPDREKIKTLAAKALSIARERRAGSLVFPLDAARSAEAAADVAEGLALRAYRFEKYKKSPTKTHDPAATLVVRPDDARAATAAVRDRLALCESVNGARDLVNEPGSVATPAEMERRARAVARRGKLGFKVLDAAQLKKEGYEGLLAVGRGGEVPPRMIVMTYRPARARSGVHLGILGKGITFDTGGVSIKPAAKMWEMKGDMAGAAATIHAMEAIARLKPPLRVTAVVCTAQNYVDSRSIVPGDIMRARNGKTIHIDNTDAEGRLVLTDGLWRMGEEKVTHLVDLATLTGAIVRALGSSLSGAFGNDDFADRVARIAGDCGEPCWRMPMVEEYRDLLDCDVADLNNIGSTPNGGAISAALFLREFVPEGIHWTHLDIAGTFLVDKGWKYFGAGATGVMVRTLTGLAEAMASEKRG